MLMQRNCEENLIDEIKIIFYKQNINVCIRRKIFLTETQLDTLHGFLDFLKEGLLEREKNIFQLAKEASLFNKGIDWWFTRHNKYSTMESIKMKQKSNLK